MRALVNFRAGCLPLWIRAFRRSRSAALSLTTHFFPAIFRGHESIAPSLRHVAIDSDILLIVNDVAD
jgi:hypothetical protein